jgi:hypothetical protein
MTRPRKRTTHAFDEANGVRDRSNSTKRYYRNGTPSVHVHAACRSPTYTYTRRSGSSDHSVAAVAIMSSQNWTPDGQYHIILQLKRSVGRGHGHHITCL